MAISSVIKFSDTPEEELGMLSKEMRLGKIIEAISSRDSVPPALREDLQQLLIVISDIFSLDAPGVDEENPLETLRMASRDINLARVLRERGIFRLYRLLNTMVRLEEEATGNPIQMPIFLTLTNPDTGEPFMKREDFIGWFCTEAKVSRALVFMRLSTIDKLLAIGYDLEGSFSVLLKKPYAVRETLKTLAEWDKSGEIAAVNPVVAKSLVAKILPAQADAVDAITQMLEDTDDPEEQAGLQKQLADVVRPALANLVEEVADHPSVKGVMDFVRYDIAARPEINYRWDTERDRLVVDYIVKDRTPGGTDYIKEAVTIPFVPDQPLPSEVKRDLLKRLPIRNRDSILL